MRATKTTTWIAVLSQLKRAKATAGAWMVIAGGGRVSCRVVGTSIFSAYHLLHTAFQHASTAQPALFTVCALNVREARKGQREQPQP